MNLETLTSEHPALVAQIRDQAVRDLTPEALKRARPDLVPEPQADTSSGDTKLEQRLVALEAENQRLKAEFRHTERGGIAREMLANADLPKLGKSGDIDLDARFERHVVQTAEAADTSDAARTAVAALIEERRALIGATHPTRNTPGIPRRATEPQANTHDGLMRSRAGLGL